MVGRRSVLVAAGLLTLAGCAGAPAPGAEPTGNRRVRVTTTTNFLTDTVGRIGGFGRYLECDGLHAAALFSTRVRDRTRAASSRAASLFGATSATASPWPALSA